MDRADLAIKMSKLVHDKCKDVPFDIGLQLLYLIEEYEGAFCQPLVSGRVCFSSDCFYHDKTIDTCVGDYAKCTVKQTHR